MGKGADYLRVTAGMIVGMAMGLFLVAAVAAA